MIDFEVINHGSLYSLRPLTDAAREWVEAHISEERTEFGGCIVVEPRYIGALVEGIVNDGLIID
jgi:hypothetical protein